MGAVGAGRGLEIAADLERIEGAAAVSIDSQAFATHMSNHDEFRDGPLFRDLNVYMGSPSQETPDAILDSVDAEPEVQGFGGWYVDMSLDSTFRWEQERFSAQGQGRCDDS